MDWTLARISHEYFLIVGAPLKRNDRTAHQVLRKEFVNEFVQLETPPLSKVRARRRGLSKIDGRRRAAALSAAELSQDLIKQCPIRIAAAKFDPYLTYRDTNVSANLK